MQIALVVLCCSLALPALAEEVSFFGGTDLNYWKEKPKSMSTPLYVPMQELPKRKKPKFKIRPLGSAIRQKDAEPFSWKDYEDPSSETFWDDGGEYVPPRPLRIVAADPTPENVRKYLEWRYKKLAAITRLENAIEQQEIETKNNQPHNKRVLEWSKIDVLFFYSSKCVHCQQSISTVNDLRQKGARVVPVQLDPGKPLLPESVQYDKEIKKRYTVTSVPSWVFNFKGKKIQLSGAVNLATIEAALEQKDD